MKRVILAALFVIIAAIVIIGALVLINKLVDVPDDEIISSELTFSSDYVKTVNIDLSAGYVDVYTLSGGSIVVSFAEPKSGVYAAAANGNVLTVTESSTSVIDSLSRGDSGRYGVRVGVPENVAIDYDVNVDYGDVSIEGVAAPSMAVDIDTGSLFLVAVNTDDITMNVNIGDVIASFPESRENYFVNVTSDNNDAANIGGGDENAPHRITISVNVGNITMSYKG